MPEVKADQSDARGVKRKRYEPPQEEMSVRVKGKLHHEIKEVHKASKKAKVFETQKVVKRLKDLKKKDETDKAIGGFEAELSALKEIDHDAIGNSALRSKVLKDHGLRENADILAAMKSELEGNLVTPATAGTTLAKIQSRLLSSKILATQVTASLTSLKFLLDPALKQRDNATDAKPAASSLAQSPDRPSKIRKGSASHDASAARKSDEAQLAVVADESDGDSDSERDDAGWESGSVGEGGEDGGEDGWESGSVGSAPNMGEDSEEEEEDSDEDSDGESDAELKVHPIQSKPQKPKPAAPTKLTKASTKMESTFLPSLSVGFVRGTDDSDFSDVEEGAAEMPKKNRRGQRARQAIWEKKFGRNANHKKKEAAAIAAAPPTYKNNKGHVKPVNTGSNAIQADQGPPGSGKAPTWSKSGTQQKGDSGWGTRSKDTSAPIATRPAARSAPKPAAVGEAKLHPSWEAKRKQKEKESAGIVPSQGTKIKFA